MKMFFCAWALCLAAIIAPGCRSAQKAAQTLLKLEAAITDSTLVKIETFAADTTLAPDTLKFLVTLDQFLNSKVPFLAADSSLQIELKIDTVARVVSVRAIKKAQKIKGFKSTTKTTVKPPDLPPVAQILAAAQKLKSKMPGDGSGWLDWIGFIGAAIFAVLFFVIGRRQKQK